MRSDLFPARAIDVLSSATLQAFLPIKRVRKSLYPALSYVSLLLGLSLKTPKQGALRMDPSARFSRVVGVINLGGGSA